MAFVKFKKISFDAVIPQYQSVDAAGMDIHSSIDVTIPPGFRVVVPTGLKIEIEKGFEGQVRSRSGLAAKNGLFVLNSPGTIDADYRGEVKVILYNAGQVEFSIKKGDRIAQLVISPYIRADICETESLSDSKRGEGGFGSTGV